MCDGAFAGSHQLSTLGSSAGRWNEDENSSSSTQVLNHQVSQQKTLRTLLSRNVAANCARDKWRSLHRSNYYSPTRRNVDVPRCLVLNARLDGFDDRTRPRTWLGQRYFSSDSETKRKGLQESQIGQELLSAAQEGSSTGLSGASQGLQFSSIHVFAVSTSLDFVRTQYSLPCPVRYFKLLINHVLFDGTKQKKFLSACSENSC